MQEVQIDHSKATFVNSLFEDVRARSTQDNSATQMCRKTKPFWDSC